MNALTIWGIRIVLIIFILAVLVAGVIISFIGTYDATVFSSNEKLVLETTNTGNGTLNVPTSLTDYSGILGVSLEVDGAPRQPLFSTSNNEPVKSNRITADGKFVWFEMKKSTGTLMVQVILDPDVQQTYALTVKKTDDLRAVPRAVGFVLFFLFVIFEVVFEIVVYKMEKKYGGGVDKRKTRFFRG